jgi:Spy/CpxP family protein refolding chaperone
MRNLLATTLAALLAIPMSGQSPFTPPDPAQRVQQQVKSLTTLLSLTAAQQQKAAAIYTDSATAEKTAHEDMKSVRQSLQSATKSNDTAAIDQASTSMGESMAQITSIHAKADAAFYQILTPAQQEKWSELESQHLGPVGAPGPPEMGPR